jgi:hypothetical protein
MSGVLTFEDEDPSPPTVSSAAVEMRDGISQEARKCSRENRCTEKKVDPKL